MKFNLISLSALGYKTSRWHDSKHGFYCVDDMQLVQRTNKNLIKHICQANKLSKIIKKSNKNIYIGNKKTGSYAIQNPCSSCQPTCVFHNDFVRLSVVTPTTAPT